MIDDWKDLERDKKTGAIKQKEFMNILLRTLFELGEGMIVPIKPEEAVKYIEKYLGHLLSAPDHELVNITKNGGIERWIKHLHWVKKQLIIKYHMLEPVESVGMGNWQLTKSGLHEAERLPRIAGNEEYIDPVERLMEVFDQLSVFEQLILCPRIVGDAIFSFDELDFHIYALGHQVENWYETVREMIPVLESTGLFKIEEDEDPELEMWALTDKGIELANILARIYKIEF